jgi:hypothetical protein
MKTTDSIENTSQISFFDMLGFGNPEAADDVEEEAKPKTRRKRLKKEIQVQLALMLDVLDTPESICDVPEEWTADDVSAIREYMLKRHIDFILDGRCGEETLSETWDWIMSEESHPFSFRACVQDMAIQMGFSVGQYIAIDRDWVRIWIYSLAKREGRVPAFCLLD